MKGFDVFKQRLKKEWDFQWGVFRGVVDWIIFVYLFIPALIFVGYNYYLWWIELPNWFHQVPLEFFFLLLYIFSWTGKLRTFLEEADQLFFIQKRSLVIELKKSTRNFYIFRYSLGLLFLFLLFAPFFIQQYDVSWFNYFNLIIYFISFRAIILVLKQYLDDIKSTWMNGFVTIGLFIIVGIIVVPMVNWMTGNYPILLLISSMTQLLLAFFYSTRRINKLTTFANDIIIDKEAKLKYIRLIFLFSENVEKERKLRKRPSIFYKQSRRVFKKRTPENAIFELLIKVLLRNKVYWLQLIQIIWITCAALFIIPPMWIKILIFIVFIFLLQGWLKVVFKRTMSNHYLAIVKADDELRYVTQRRVVNSFSIPVICMVGIILLLIIL